MEHFIITVTPQQLRALQGWNATPAHLAYRIGRGPHLFRAGNSPAPRGGLMVVGDSGFDGLGGVSPFCQEVLRECQARGFSGAVLDFESRLPPLEQMASQLDDAFARRRWTLYVPEVYGLCAPSARVMIPSALSGGSLAQRLEEAQARFQNRVVLALQIAAEDFSLPSPAGSGVPLTQEALEERMERLHPAVFFSGDLCARYFTYMDQGGGAHFVLFDDGDTLRRKVEVARQAGIDTFLISWQEAENHTAQLGLRRQGQSGRPGV